MNKLENILLICALSLGSVMTVLCILTDSPFLAAFNIFFAVINACTIYKKLSLLDEE